MADPAQDPFASTGIDPIGTSAGFVGNTMSFLDPIASPGASSGTSSGTSTGTTATDTSSIGSDIGGLLGNLGSYLSNNAGTLGVGAYGLAEAQKQKAENAALAGKLYDPANQLISSGLSQLGNYTNLTPTQKSALDTGVNLGNTLTGQADPLLNIGRTGMADYTAGNLPAWQKKQLDQKTAAAKALARQSLGANVDSSTLAQIDEQIDSQAQIAQGQMMNANLAAAQASYQQGTALEQTGGTDIQNAYNTATSDINNNLKNALSTITTGLGPLEDAIKLQIAGDTSVTNSLNALFAALAKQASTSGSSGSSIGSSIGSIVGKIGSGIIDKIVGGTTPALPGSLPFGPGATPTYGGTNIPVGSLPSADSPVVDGTNMPQSEFDKLNNQSPLGQANLGNLSDLALPAAGTTTAALLSNLAGTPARTALITPEEIPQPTPVTPEAPVTPETPATPEAPAAPGAAPASTIETIATVAPAVAALPSVVAALSGTGVHTLIVAEEIAAAEAAGTVAAGTGAAASAAAAAGATAAETAQVAAAAATSSGAAASLSSIATTLGVGAAVVVAGMIVSKWLNSGGDPIAEYKKGLDADPGLPPEQKQQMLAAYSNALATKSYNKAPNTAVANKRNVANADDSDIPVG